MTEADGTRCGVLRVGDRLRFDGGEHTVVGLTGASVRLVGDDGVDQLVLVTHLQAAADFALLSGSGPVCLPPLSLLDAAPAAVVERARWWERHLVEVQTGLPADAEPGAIPRPGYDPAGPSITEPSAQPTSDTEPARSPAAKPMPPSTLIQASEAQASRRAQATGRRHASP